MVHKRNCVLSIAGFDPSAGAGMLADIKTFEALHVYGVGAVTALTFQNDTEFDGVKWIDVNDVVNQVSVLKRRFNVAAVKVGLVQNLDTLKAILEMVTCPVTWDPVIKASAGFEFHKILDENIVLPLLKHVFLITPNIEEIKFLTGINDPIKAAETLSAHCNVLLKGGHNLQEPGTDYLFIKGQAEVLLPSVKDTYPKHGSGCVLSSAVAANLALGYDLSTSCRSAKKYIEQFLSSHTSLIGTHYAQ